MKWALIVDNSVREVTNTDPAGRYHKSLVWVKCGDEVGPGYGFANGAFLAPVAPVPETLEQIQARAIDEVRTERAPMLNALAGIGFDANFVNDAATQTAVAQARADLKAITALPDFLNAATYDDMKAAIMARYREIAAAAPANVQTAFREIIAP